MGRGRGKQRPPGPLPRSPGVWPSRPFSISPHEYTCLSATGKDDDDCWCFTYLRTDHLVFDYSVYDRIYGDENGSARTSAAVEGD